MRNFSILMVLVFFLTGCGRGAYQERLQKHYWITALDSMDELALMNDSSGYMINIVGPKIIKYHSGKNCIAVLRKSIKDSNFWFYIVPFGNMAIDKSEEKNLIGPLNLESFNKKFEMICKELLELVDIES